MAAATTTTVLSAAYATGGEQESDAMSISSGSDASHSDMGDDSSEGGSDAGSNHTNWQWYCCLCGPVFGPVN